MIIGPLDTVLPSSDHYCIGVVVPSSDHCYIETVPPSSNNYGTKRVAPPSDNVQPKVSFQRWRKKGMKGTCDKKNVRCISTRIEREWRS